MCDSNMSSGLIWMEREAFDMVSLLIDEFSHKSSFNEILGSSKIDNTCLLDVMIMCNYKFINFIITYLDPPTRWEYHKLDFNCSTVQSVQKLLTENLSIFSYIQFARAHARKLDLLSELHKLCNELIKCIDCYLEYIN